MNSRFRSGDCVSTRSGLTSRMTRLISRRSSRVVSTMPSGNPRKRPSLTPTTEAAARRPPQLGLRLDHAGGEPEEAHVADADHGGRGALLVLAERRHFGTGHGAVG